MCIGARARACTARSRAPHVAKLCGAQQMHLRFSARAPHFTNGPMIAHKTGPVYARLAACDDTPCGAARRTRGEGHSVTTCTVTLSRALAHLRYLCSITLCAATHTTDQRLRWVRMNLTYTCTCSPVQAACVHVCSTLITTTPATTKHACHASQMAAVRQPSF